MSSSHINRLLGIPEIRSKLDEPFSLLGSFKRWTIVSPTTQLVASTTLVQNRGFLCSPKMTVGFRHVSAILLLFYLWKMMTAM
jgi:hypothetical protein